MKEKDKTKDKRRLERFWQFLYRFVGPRFARKYNYSRDLIELDPPFLFICNHVTNDDSILTGFTYKKAPLAYVASEHIFRQGIISKLLMRCLAPIPRPKADSGVGTVRAVLKRLREGDPVALFAEGDCTWDGVSGRVFPATGKLAKAAGVPLVTYRLEGGYLTSPRWSKKLRRGKMRGRLVNVYSPEELKAMTADDAEAAINRDIYYDSWAEQRKNPVPFRSKAPAEGLERALFICPVCGGTDCLSSKGNTLSCKKCGANWGMDEFGFLHGERFETLAEWDEWQRSAVSGIAGSGYFRVTGKLTDFDNNASGKAEVSLDADRKALNVSGKLIPFGEIKDMAMVKTNRLLFTDGAGYHEIKIKNGILRPYLMAWQASRRETEDR